MYRLLIDDREGAVTAHLADTNIRDSASSSISSEVTRLARGDYAIMKDMSLLAVFERKTYTDFAASIKDGRSLNREGLTELREKSSAQIFYLIEHPGGTPKDSDKFAGIAYSSIRASIYRLMFFEGFSVIYSTGQKDTLVQLYNFIDAISRASSERSASRIGGDATLLAVPKQKRDPHLVAWEAIPQIGKAISSDLARSWPLIDIISFRVPYDELVAWRSDSGAKLNKRQIDSLLTSNTTSILGAIDGVSKGMAGAIVESLPDSLADEKALASIAPQGKRALGKKRAATILALLSNTMKEA